jgi:hypothetical protein
MSQFSWSLKRWLPAGSSFLKKNITAVKQQHMFNTTQYYSAEHESDHWQIDPIAVEGKPYVKPIVTHFEGII